MARINKKSVNLGALEQFMKDLDRKFSIKVGIIGEKAREIHPDSDLTNAELGAVHEFGATINVTKKMRNYLHSQGIHLNKDTTTVVIPTRSFLRMPLLRNEGKKELLNVVKAQISNEFKAKELSPSVANKILDETIHFLAETAYLQILNAFKSGGFGNWAPISEFTEKKRYNADNPPLTNKGDLRKSISYEIKEIK